jgi:hypothetical protein
LGDLVVAEYAYHYEVGKARIDENSGTTHDPEWITYGTAKRILQYIRTFRAWEEPVAEIKCKPKSVKRPKRLIGPIASGMTVRSDDPFPELQQHNRKDTSSRSRSSRFLSRAP